MRNVCAVVAALAVHVAPATGIAGNGKPGAELSDPIAPRTAAPAVFSRDVLAPPAIVADLAPRNADRPGEVAKVELGLGVTLELVWLPAGTFTMGSDEGHANEKPARTVRITRGFWMGRYEVTQAQWELVMNSRPSYFDGATRPVEQVSWYGSQKFVETLNGMVRGGGFRLPTEAEWEYACRAGTTNRYSFGDREAALFSFGNYCEAACRYDLPWKDTAHNDGHDGTAPVGSFKPNPWGLFDMHGNVWEWCQDWFGAYRKGEADDPRGPATGTARVLRGGSWYYKADFCRSAFRTGCIPVLRSSNIGFRVVYTR